MEHPQDAYSFYGTDGHEQQYYPTTQVSPYHQVHPQQPRHHQLDIQPQFHTYSYYSQQTQPPSPHVEPSPPPSPEQMYSDGPISPQLSGSDTSGDGIYSPQASPTSSRANSLVQRHGRPYDPTPSPTGSLSRRRRGRSHGDSDDEDLGYGYQENVATTRKEATRQQRIQAEQRRRDELRDGYAKLKDVLPVSNQKSSKVSLLDRATNHITALELENKNLSERIASLEEEIRRISALNAKFSGGSLDTPSPGMYERPLSPPPEVATPMILPVVSSLAGATGDGSTASTPSDNGY
ncbi:BHLH domain-containing protein [Mycena indigotica]|uniref:BHLH domain-containing protein n=1 Tax=Mycena indigotica TaxID=2126181 RepID=A0A8H6T0U5_9AGAR|nr:BHLH domain-containing protein [Mycena indigotica]KAF7307405.1 BHLH domain-containing protein [Mycena indigotica]